MNIKEIREKAFLTQELFAKEIGVSIVSIQKWEWGKSKPSLRNTKKIVEFCKERGINYETN